MLNIRWLGRGLLSLVALSLTACWNGPDTTGTITITIPNSFPSSGASQTINVSLAVNPSTNPGLGFSNLTLHTNPTSAISNLSISNSSSCYAITPDSTATSCTFTVSNTGGTSGQTALDSASFTVTGQLNGQTVTSNVARPNEQPTTGSYWTITIDNTASSSTQYLFIFGQDPTTDDYGVVVFDSNNYGTFHTYSSTTQYGSDEDSIPIAGNATTVIHIPFGIAGGRAYISSAQMQGLELTSNGGIVTPTPGTSGSTNFNTVYDDFEFTYDTTGSNTAAVINQTAVDFLSTPLCLTGSSNYQPVQQAGYCNITRTALLNSVESALTDTGVPSEWDTLILHSTVSPNPVVRIMNPGDEASSFATSFNTYLAALASTYAADNSLVVQNNGATLSGKIVTSAGPTYTYQFTCTAGSCGSGTSMPLTAANLLTGSAPSTDNNLVTAYQMISSAFMAGQLPDRKSVV